MKYPRYLEDINDLGMFVSSCYSIENNVLGVCTVSSR